MVTLIIPVYNSSTTIARCINSVKRQNINSFEVIIVDDGSTDDSLKICQSLVDDDDRFRIIHQSNNGVSSARNAGIENATCEYICFMDADDEISSNYLEDLEKGIHSCDLLIHGMMRYRQGEHIDRRMHIEGVFNLDVDGSSFFNSINIERYGGPYCKLYKKSIIINNNIKFNTKVRLAEDFDFLLRYLACCHTVKTQNKCNYIYYETMGSATTKIYTYEDEMNILNALDLSWQGLRSRFDIESLKILHHRSLSYYVSRIVPSIYLGNRTKRQRLACLHSIPNHCLDAYQKHYMPETIFMTLTKTLISKRKFFLFDLAEKLRIKLL